MLVHVFGSVGCDRSLHCAGCDRDHVHVHVWAKSNPTRCVCGCCERVRVEQWYWEEGDCS